MGSVTLRIALFGNVANTLYHLAKSLRAHSSFDVHLYLDRGHHPAMLPESADPDLVGRYPEWIHLGRFLGKRRYLFPWTSPVVAELSRFDLVIVSGEGPIFAQFCRTPWFFYVTGADLTLLPFPLRFWSRHKGLRAKAVNVVLGLWQARGIRRATEVWSQPFSPLSAALRRLGLPQHRVAPEYFPIAVDTDRLRPEGPVRDAQALELRASHDLIIFHPSRLMIAAGPTLRGAGQWKQNDLLIRAFASFVREGISQSPVLVMVDRVDSIDIRLARELARDLGVDKHVIWLRPPQATGFTREEMLTLYWIADVVADDFGVGWFGAVILEALALGIPVVSYIDDNPMKALYPWHPVLSARTEAEIRDWLVKLYLDPAWRRQIAQLGRAWIEEFHSESKVAERYVRNVRSAAARAGR